MFDIQFFQKSQEIKERITGKKINMAQAPALVKELDTLRSRKPTVFNIETTNNCNMKCVMCPRTLLMDRALNTMREEDFLHILNQVQPHSPSDLAQFWKFITDQYDLRENEKSENSFYFYIISQCLTLHGYGEPLLDPQIVNRVREASARNIPTYFSCVPANLSVARATQLMEAGLTVLKVSIDALDEDSQKRIRGSRNNFQESFDTVLAVLKEKKRLGLKTLIVPTMIVFSNDEAARSMYERFLQLWDGLDVFAYVKSQDNRWFFENDNSIKNQSHYAKQYCEYPWSSLSVQANGDVGPCPQDYNGEMKFGNIRENSLEEIWNNEKYQAFREWHVTGQFPAGHKCATRCDQKKVFEYLNAAAKN